MSKRTDYEVIKTSFESKGWELLTVEYINNKQKLDYICPRGHRHSMSWSDWKNKNVGCPYCNGRPIITLEIVRQAMAKEGYILLTEEYINNKQRLDYICPNGHLYHTTWAKWNSHAYRCPYCYGNAKKTIEEIREDVEKYNYILITKIYINCYTKLHLICPNGHDYFVTWDNWSSKHSRCPRCNIHGVSKEETVLSDFIKSVYSGIIINNNYSLIKPKEIDIVIPDKMIAIEYCGLYWHSEMRGKGKNYHLNKLNLCADKGYTLITVFSDEFINKEIVFNKLKNLLGCNKSKIVNNKDCSISEVTPVAIEKFYKQHSLQVNIGSSINIGMFYKEKLISVMSFKECPSSNWEIVNFCQDVEFNVVDGFQILLTYFENNFEWEEIIYYEDRRWSTDTNYNSLGFKNVETIEPSCWGIKKDKRVYKIAKKDLVSENQDLNRIWDCGYSKHTKTKGEF